MVVAAAVYASAAVNLGGDDAADRVRATQVSARFFDVLNVPPSLGQSWRPDEGLDTATISDGLWRRRFESRPDVLGRPLLLNGRRYTIARVMPRGFAYPDRTEVWIRATFPDNPFTGTMVFRYLGRLRAAATLPAAQAEMSAISAHPRASSGGPPARPLVLKPLQAELVKSIQPTLWLLAAAVGCLFLIGCVNVASLLLARGAARSREMSLRAALGASRSRLVGQMLTENAVIAALAGGLGLAIGWWTLTWLVAQVPGDVRLEGVTMNMTVMGFGVALSALALFLFGLMPALTTSQVTVQQGLREASGGIGGRRPLLLNLLVISEVALATILLTTAGLLARSFANVAAIDTGFEPSQALTFDVSLSKPRYETPEQRTVFLTDVRARLSALPGVRSVGYVSVLPLSGARILGGAIEVDGHPATTPEAKPSAARLIAGPGYFEALTIPTLEGRTFTDADRAQSPRVAIVNRAFAKQVWGSASPIGSRVRFDFQRAGEWREVIGVVGDVRYRGPESDAAAVVYLSGPQEPGTNEMSVVIGTAGRADDLIGPARQAIQTMDPALPMFNVRTMAGLYREATASRRFAALLVGTFAGTGLVLMAIGVFGVLSYVVSQRTREIGLRLALGSEPRGVRRLVLRDAIVLTTLGGVIGGVASLALGRVVSGFLYGVRPTDPATLATAALVLIVVTVAAAYGPARRASSVDPLIALRDA
jgi:predicted permease